MAYDIVRKTSAVVAYNIREAGERLGTDLSVEDIDWGIGKVLSRAAREAIVRALKFDLYIDARDAECILAATFSNDRYFTRSLLEHLQEEPPLFLRVSYVEQLMAKPDVPRLIALIKGHSLHPRKPLLRKEMEKVLKPALQKIAKDDPNPLVAERAKEFLKKL